MSDAVDLLKEQHAEVTALFMQIERATDPVLRSKIFRTIDASLRTHAVIEEQIFYPAFKKRAKNNAQAGEVSEALSEHQRVKDTLAELERGNAGSEQFARGMAVLKHLVQQHVLEEESGMLKQARRLFRPVELEELAHRMESAAMHASPVYDMAGSP